MNPEEKRHYAEVLDSLWGRYLTFVNFLVTAAGGTVIILFANVLDNGLNGVATMPSQLVFATIIAGVCAVSCIFWRAAAHRYMEYELLAPFGRFEDYIGSNRTDCAVTDPHGFERSPWNGFYKRMYQMAVVVNPVLLLASWTLIATAFI